MPLDLAQLRRAHIARTRLCAVHGRRCPVGGGTFPRSLFDALRPVWDLQEVPPPSWSEWVAAETAQCRPATPGERQALTSVDVAGEREATREAAEQALAWLAENGATDAA